MIMCPSCKQEVNPEDIFCSNCGTKIPDKYQPIPTGKKISIYILTFLLAPFGLFWFFKFNRDENPYKKAMVKNVLIITAIAIIVMVILGTRAISLYNQLLDDYMYNTNLYGLK